MERLNALCLPKLTFELMQHIINEFDYPLEEMKEDDEFFEYDIMEILIGQIKNDFKVGDIFDTGTI